jgi:Arc/MetJ-type ribon-helix-helix transcriptional regulator
MTTITEGLAELKTLRKRIDKKRESLGPYLARAEAVRDPLEKQGGSEKHIKAERQAIDDLEKWYIKLRRGIAAANDATIVTVCGLSQPISDWLIWRREIAPHRKAWLDGMRNGIHQLRTKTQSRGGSLVSATAINVETKPDDIIVNIDEAALDKEREELEEILGTLDGQLSLKNATTEI